MKKSSAFRNKNYLNFIRQQDCIVDGHNHGVVAHHIRIDHFGMGQKPSDYRAVPLTQMRHQELHNNGERSFFENHGKAHELETLTHMIKYLIYEVGITEELLQDFEQILEKFTNHSV